MSDEKYEPSSDVKQSGVRFISAMRRLEIHFNRDQPIDLGPYSAVLSAACIINKGFSTTDALEAALVCGTTDDVELICDYLSLSSEEKTRQYSQKKKHALSSFDEKEETRTPQKSRPRLYTDRTYRPIKHEKKRVLQQPNAPPAEEKKQQYSQALSSFDEVETCSPQKQRPQPSWINDNDSKMKSLTMSKLARAKKLQRSDEIIQHVKRQRHQSVACAPRVIYISDDIYLVVSTFYTPGGLLFEKLPGFVRTVSVERKRFLWKDAVKIKTADAFIDSVKIKIACKQTQDKIKRAFIDAVKIKIAFIASLLSGCIKDLDGDIDRKEEQSYVANVTMFILSEYHSLHREKFENDENYFADMLEEYEKKHIVYRNGTNT